MSMSEYPTKGVFCHKLREIHAVRVEQNNEEQLQSFVLGGKYMATQPGKKRIFLFDAITRATRMSATFIANEGDWIVTEDGTEFEVMNDAQFRRDYEPK